MFSTPSTQMKAKSSSHQLEGALKEDHALAEDVAPVAQCLPGRSKALGSIPRAKRKKKKEKKEAHPFLRRMGCSC